MVLPSPHLIFAEKVREVTRQSQDLFVKGDTIGGGVFAFAVKKHIQEGLRGVMAEKAAYTIRNVLQEGRELGIEVVSRENPPPKFNGKTLSLQEVNLTQLGEFLNSVNEEFSDVEIVVVAVQDHRVYPEGNEQ